MKYINDYLLKLDLKPEITDYYEGRTILVTGGAGAVGSNLVIILSKLVKENGKVVILDNLSSIKTDDTFNVPNLDNVMFIKGDVRNEIDLKRVFQEKPSLVFHLAAFFANQNSVDYPERSADVDVIGHIKLLQMAHLTKVDRFIYASSGCAIYGSYPKLPLKEDFISMHLTTPYQINKMVGEMYNNYYQHAYDFPIVNCRFFNSYGPGEIPGQYRNVIPNFIFWAMSGNDLPITGDGSETRDFTYVLDLVQGLIKSGYDKNAIGENFNLAAGIEISITDMAKKVIEASGKNIDIKFAPRRKWDTKPRLCASIEKAANLIDYKPIVSFDEGFRENVIWFNENWSKISKLADFKPGMNSAVRKK